MIAADGAQLGIIDTDIALKMAEEQGLDLVEVAPLARPPVVRIMDYGKYKFEQAKQARAAKKKQHVIELKEVKFRRNIDDGRQIAHPELGRAVVQRVAAELQDLAKVETDARLEGKAMTMILTPK